MEDFSKQISEFQKHGTYDYKFDEGGNLVFNQFSTKFNEHYLSIPLINFGYNNSKIESFYNLDFKEFIPTTTKKVLTEQVSVEVTQLTTENKELKDKLTELIKISDSNTTESERLAIKQVILDLRLQLKQGKFITDFSDAFPYLPITNNNT